jgi:peptidoglycan hydrolase CwlO-like protein
MAKKEEMSKEELFDILDEDKSKKKGKNSKKSSGKSRKKNKKLKKFEEKYKKENERHKKKLRELIKEQNLDSSKGNKKEHAAIIILTAIIVVLLIAIGYSVYTYMQKDKEATEKIYSLNGTIADLVQERNLLLEEKTNLTLEIDSMNQTISVLEGQKQTLTTRNNNLQIDKEGLTTQIDDLQDEVDSLTTQLESAEDDLDDCLSSCSS